MPPENQDDSEVLETPEETVEEINVDTTEEETLELSREEIEVLKAKAAKADELERKNKQLFERAKKQSAAPQTDALSPMDVVLLSKSDVDANNIEEVLTYAKYRNMTVAEALKDTTLRAILKEKKEEQQTAAATQTRSSARGSSKVSGSDLLTKAETSGEVPDTVEGMRAIAEARLARKRAAQS